MARRSHGDGAARGAVADDDTSEMVTASSRHVAEGVR